MSKIYFNQADARWKNHPYPASPGYENKTVGTSGCGPTCVSMIVSSCKETVTPDAMCDIARANGYRVPGGTSDGFFQFAANKWGIEMKRVYSSFEAHQACKEGYFVVICCRNGLWSTGGHFILAVGATDTDIEIYDPYLYNGKFNNYGRAGKVRLEGVSAWVEINTFKAHSNAQRFFAFKVGDVKPEPQQEPKEKFVNTSSMNLNVRNNPNGAVVGSLPKGTKVTVYEEQAGWSKIGEGKWVASNYLADVKPETPAPVAPQPQPKTMYVKTTNKNLNVREKPNGKVIGSLAKGASVTVVNNENGWSQITAPINGYVSTAYLSESSTKPAPAITRNTVGQTKTFKGQTVIYSKSNLSGTKYNYKANTTVKVLQNTSNIVDKVKVNATGRIGYVNISAYK